MTTLPEPGGADADALADADRGFVDSLEVLIRGLPRIIVAGLIAAVGAVGVVWTLGPKFEAMSSFAPAASPEIPTRMAGLASQLGFSLPMSAGEQSIDFYAALLKSNEFMRTLATKRFRFEDADGELYRGTYIELYGIKGDTPDERLLEAVARLEREVEARPELQAGMVTVRTLARWPVLAEQINLTLLELVNDFNVQKRQNRAQVESRFVAARLDATRAVLEEAEADLERFLRANRMYESSPTLRFEAARLERRVELQQQVFVTLAQALEQARIDEVRNTPVITVVDRPVPGSARKVGIGMASAGLLAAVFAMLLAAAVLLLRQHWLFVASRFPHETNRLRSALLAAARRPVRSRID